ncbi:hypothetical protein DB32_000114 [Sandaracinus amylolyticus]|uniref:Uncharacterized protein n=2 Tax=Sandaracinus amylolyticus TaxID=927083 RepID=A0A0F6YFQ9_9BACT|nr:hypothetical protein DB32_000114 [Sandaracinus amylolyticus]
MARRVDRVARSRVTAWHVDRLARARRSEEVMKISLPAITIALGGVVSVVALVSGIVAGCGARADAGATSSSTTYVAASGGGDAPAPEGAKQPFSLDAGVVLPMPDAGIGAFPLEPTP